MLNPYKSGWMLRKILPNVTLIAFGSGLGAGSRPGLGFVVGVGIGEGEGIGVRLGVGVGVGLGAGVGADSGAVIGAGAPSSGTVGGGVTAVSGDSVHDITRKNMAIATGVTSLITFIFFYSYFAGISCERSLYH